MCGRPQYNSPLHALARPCTPFCKPLRTVASGTDCQNIQSSPKLAQSYDLDFRIIFCETILKKKRSVWLPSALLALARPCAPLHALLRALAHRCLWRRLQKHSVIIQAGLVICSRFLNHFPWNKFGEKVHCVAALRITRPYTPLRALTPLHALMRALAHRCLWRRLPKHSVIIQAGLVICSRRSFFLPLKLPFILLFWPLRRMGAAPAARRATTVNRRAPTARQCRGFCWWGRRTAVAKAFFLSQRRRATLTLAYFTGDNFLGIIIQNEISGLRQQRCGWVGVAKCWREQTEDKNIQEKTFKNKNDLIFTK